MKDIMNRTSSVRFIIKGAAMQTEQSTLYIISTPIGNLGDITLRALNILGEVDFILCEDTRHSIKLLNHYSIKKPLVSYHKFNEKASINLIIERLRSGECAALISDAGTPLISDPGSILIKELIKENIDFFVVPGANALIPAMIMSGFETTGFDFRGFLPKNRNEKKRILSSISESDHPVIFYIASHELKTVLKMIDEILPNRKISLSKELTKIHEATFRGTASKVAESLIDERGEFVLVLDANKAQKKELPDSENLKAEFDNLCLTTNRNEALKILADKYDVKKRDLYSILMVKNSHY